MPRRRKDPEPDVQDAVEAVLEELGEDEVPRDVADVLAELGEDVNRVNIYRNVKGSPQKYVGVMDVDEFSLEEVGRRWGGGRYVMRFNKTTGGFKKAYTFYIDDAVKPEPVAVREAREGATGMSGSFQEQLLLKLLDRPPTPAVDWSAVASTVAAVMGAMKTDPAALFAAMTAATAPLLSRVVENGGKGSNSKDLFDAIQLGLSMGGEKDEGYLPVIREVGVPLVRALETMMAHQGATRRVLPRQPGGTTVDTPADNPLPEWAQQLQPYIGRVVKWASTDDDPGLWATVIAHEVPDLDAFLVANAPNPSFEMALYQHFPQLAPHRTWVRAFLDEFLPDAPEPAATPEAGAHGDDAE